MLKDYNAKLNWQVTSSNMFSAYWFLGEKIKLGRPNTRGLGTETPSTHAIRAASSSPTPTFRTAS